MSLSLSLFLSLFHSDVPTYHLFFEVGDAVMGYLLGFTGGEGDSSQVE